MWRVFLDTFPTYLSCINFNVSFTLAFTQSQVWFMWLHWKAPCLNKHSAKQPKRNSTRTEVDGLIRSECADRCLHIHLHWSFAQWGFLQKFKGDWCWLGHLPAKPTNSQRRHPRTKDRCLQLNLLCLSEAGWSQITCFPSLSSASLYHPT